jgi:hypothetical protein
LANLADLVIVIAGVLHVGVVVVGACWVHCFDGQGVAVGFEDLCGWDW